MARLHFTTDDPHDALTRVLALFRVTEVPLDGIEGRYEAGAYSISLTIPDNPDRIEALVYRLARLVSVGDVRIQDAPVACFPSGAPAGEGESRWA